MNQSVEHNAASRKRRLPLAVRIIYWLFAVSAVLYVLFLFFPSVADFCNRWVSPVVRAILAHLTNFLPCSLAELLLLLSPVILFLVFRFGMRHHTDSWRSVGRFCVCVGSAAALVFSLFTFGFAAAYRGTPLDERLGMARRGVSKEDLYETAMILAEKINEESKALIYLDDGFSVMPCDLNEMNDALLDAYDRVIDEYGVVDRLYSRIKPVVLSKPMSYTHITGVYTFFTGEANLNVYFPDYTLPFTAAHELAHQRGIAREDEANFVAFLVCERSDNAYIRYSGYLNLYEYVMSKLHSASPELYMQVQWSLRREVLGELAAYSDFFEEFRDSVVGEVSGAINDTFLVLHGTEGVKSYGMVVDLAVVYFIPEQEGVGIQ